MDKQAKSLRSNGDVGQRKQWVTPQVQPLGKASQLLLGGGGKLSCTGGDPGEMRLEKGGGNVCP